MADGSGEAPAADVVNIGVLTVSDSCSKGSAEDKSGAKIKSLINNEQIIPGGKVVEYQIVADEYKDIRDCLLSWCDEVKLDLILTTGGTGFAPRDVTPESTRSILQKEAPGLTLAMLQGSLKVTQLAMLSRPVCGIRGRTLIINLPGSRKAVEECLEFVRPALGHALDILHDNAGAVKVTHAILQGEGVGKAVEKVSCEQSCPLEACGSMQSGLLVPSIQRMHSYSTPPPVSDGPQARGIVPTVQQSDFCSPQYACSHATTRRNTEQEPAEHYKNAALLSQEPNVLQNDISTSAAFSNDEIEIGGTVPTCPDPGSANNSPVPVLLDAPNSVQTLELSDVEGIKVNEGDGIQLIDSSNPRSKGDSNDIEGKLERSQVLSEGEFPYEKVEISGNKLCDSIEISAEQILDNEQLLTEEQMVETDVTSLSDFSFPEETQVDGQLIGHITPAVNNLLQSSPLQLLPTARPSSSRKQSKRHIQLKQDTALVGQQRSCEESGSILPAKMHRKNKQDKFYTVPVGQGLKQFLASHPLVKGLYLNRGKRDVKRNLVSLQRHTNAVDKGSWQRGNACHERNRLDDQFTPTAEGCERISLIAEKRIRDEYVVNWYLWCPGHGNCRRKCGGFGTCQPGCKGMAHKQDRHNCSILLNLKLFLSDVTHWRVYLAGSHVPPDAGIDWQPPAADQQRLDEDMRDLITAHSDHANTADIVDLMAQRRRMPEEHAVKKRVAYFVSSMKKRRKERDYNYAKTVQQTGGSGAHESGPGPIQQTMRLDGADADLATMKDGLCTLQPGSPIRQEGRSTSGQTGAVSRKTPQEGGNHEVILIQADSASSDLVTLCEMMNSSTKVIQIQTTAATPLVAAQVHDVQSHQGSDGGGGELAVANVGELGPPRVFSMAPDQSTCVAPISARRCAEVVSGMTMQDVTSLNDLGALLLTASQQK